MPALATTKLSSRGQVVIPEPIRKALGLKVTNAFMKGRSPPAVGAVQ